MSKPNPCIHNIRTVKRAGVFYALCLMLCFGTIVSHSQNIEQQKKVFTLQQEFLNNLNSGNETKFLSLESGFIYGDSLVVGPEQISGLWKEIKGEYRGFSYDTIASFQLYPEQLFVHGEYKTGNGKIFSSVIGWIKRDGWIKAFEAVAPRGNIQVDRKTETNLLRASWELYSNQHRPDLIAEKVFAPSGQYFYRGTVYKGMDIADAYSYMKDVNYSIDLTPQKVIPVNSELTYEIGIFDTGGKGLYFLMWGKAGEEWKLLLDFNF